MRSDGERKGATQEHLSDDGARWKLDLHGSILNHWIKNVRLAASELDSSSALS